MSFKETFPDYANYDETDLYFSRVPTGMSGAILGIVQRFVPNADELKGLCRMIAGYVPCEPTSNWGWDWLLNDLESLLRQLSQKKFHRYMDVLREFASVEGSAERIEYLNEVFEEYDLGYTLVDDPSAGVTWRLRTEVIVQPESLVAAREQVRDICEQAAEHLKKAMQHLSSSDDVRARKDAVRDSLSAMEALVKQLTGEAKFEDAVKKLRDGSWGPDTITKDGLSIWNRIHDLYPDVRHGSPEVTNLPHTEAVYWIERIMLYVSYLHRINRGRQTP